MSSAYTNDTTISQVFCCRECGSPVALNVLPGGDLAYECVSPRCCKTVHVDCPEGLAVIDEEALEPFDLPTIPNEEGYQEMNIGVIDGCTVWADYHEGDLYAAEIERNGYRARTDGVDYINLPGSGGCIGDMKMEEWAFVVELVRSGAGDRLVELAREHAKIAKPAKEARLQAA
jgi:hypothetical protein